MGLAAVVGQGGAAGGLGGLGGGRSVGAVPALGFEGLVSVGQGMKRTRWGGGGVGAGGVALGG